MISTLFVLHEIIMHKTRFRQAVGWSEILGFNLTLRNSLFPAIKSLMAVANDRLNAQLAGLMKNSLIVIKLN